MKAIIFNSGLGKRMGRLTENNHKSMVKLLSGEAVFLRQLRILIECGIKEFIITTGPFENILKSAASAYNNEGIKFTFINNPVYDKTNYIYSMYLAREHLCADMLLLHGDLVFSKSLIRDILNDKRSNLAAVNMFKALPAKDFKCRIKDNKIYEISVNIFDSDCFAFQPLYKLDKSTISQWTEKVCEFIKNGNDKVYAENALNEILPELNICTFEYGKYYIDEIDTVEDLNRVGKEIQKFDFDEQKIYDKENAYLYIEKILKENSASKPMLVCGRSFDSQAIKEYIYSLNLEIIRFSNFRPNPDYDDVIKGVKLFKDKKCDFIISIGGGSAIDTAKCIKLFSGSDENINYLKQEYKYNFIKHLAIPTTAGSGSECTRFSVLYYKGEKQSITHDGIIPDYVILDPKLLLNLPVYQKKSTMLDALCQAVESYWSVNSSAESKAYSKDSISLILQNLENALLNDLIALKNIQKAAYLSGKAINITQTTAAHAMSYKLTSIYNLAHGHAVSLCLPYIWEYMINNLDKCIDPRGGVYLKNTFEELNKIFNAKNSQDCIYKFREIYDKLNLSSPKLNNKTELKILADSVNLQRLKNNPITLDKEIIKKIYNNILN